MGVDFILLMVMILAFYASPGPAVISIVASGISFGFKKSVPYVWGIIAGGLFVVAASLFSVHFLVNVDDIVVTLLKGISFVYMLYLVYKIWRAEPFEVKSKDAPLSFTNGVLLSLFNPKAYIITVALFVQFITSQTTIAHEFILALIVIISFTIIDFFYSYLGGAMYKILQNKKLFGSINKIMAFLLLSIIIFLAYPG